MKDKKEAEKTYDKLADYYHEKRQKGTNANDFIEMPASLKLLGDVRGKRILDAGCGSGIYSKLLAKKGAKVSGIEISQKMIDYAEEYCERFDIDFRKGSIDKLQYKNNFFDCILCSLVVHYLKEPERVFKEFNRVLKKDGVLVFSTNNPAFTAIKEVKQEKGKNILSIVDYFKKKKYYWKMHKSDVRIPSYPLEFEKLFDILYKTGFVVEKFKEPYMVKRDKKIPKHLKKWAEIPTFIVLKCRKIR